MVIIQPRIATAAIIVDDQRRILMLRRAPDASIGAGEWAIPGGKLEPGELLDQCVRREVAEETGIACTKTRRIPNVTEDLAWGPDEHFVTMYYLVTKWTGFPTILEPHKHVDIGWFDLPRILAATHGEHGNTPLFEPMLALVRSGGLNYV